MNIDPNELEKLVELYYKDVYQFALYYSNSKEAAEEITQETFIKSYRNINQLKNKSKYKTWLFSIAKNTAIDYIRKDRYFHNLKNLIVINEKRKSNSFGKSFSSDLELWEILQAGILSLKPYYRTLVILKGLKELSIKEISEILACKESKVRVDYHRALKQIKKNLEERGYFYEEA
ncbi:RNA polymerase sigma factor [Sutcliffiella rhizosphaerae]|uniref:RNA polymerase sigma factor n=1 Tax=Sutcliffiella rhizosphaerae TaxID=2880967 RepID=A0ABM8YPZ3_9BACI|nr:RNA polymerase sigma factor [Sutcliffiella rhizosphaerae]CAG9622039.1 ECF RNA polymerase sigma factor SigW [Sutcliffiella rhizosphaerae]